jgi:hypothetical protein
MSAESAAGGFSQIKAQAKTTLFAGGNEADGQPRAVFLIN